MCDFASLAISMGGTLIRLVDQGHEVHVAYQTSGNKNKKPGQVDSEEVQKIKGLIRRGEGRQPNAPDAGSLLPFTHRSDHNDRLAA
jgi:hypothetical protein